MPPMNLKNRLAELGVELPVVTPPVAAYVPAVATDRQVIVSGQLPLVKGTLARTGLVPQDVSLQDAQALARTCIINALAAADHALGGDWSRFERVLRVGVFVAGAPQFTSQHLVANGASEFLAEVFGDAGPHARAAVGVSSLPLNAPVEVELLIGLKA